MNDNTFKPCMVFHPGETLQEKLEEMDMQLIEFAKQTEIPLYIIEDVVAGRTSITSDMAMAFEQVTQIPAHYWMKAQHNYDEFILTNKKDSYKFRLNSLRRVAAIL